MIFRPGLFLLAMVAACGQTRSIVPDSGSGNLPLQPIGANDLLAVSVYDAPELTRTVRVDTDGFIRMPMLKEKIRAAGHMPSEMETAIADALKAEQLIVQPFVTVTVAEYNSRPINVMGAVRKPLTFQAAGRIRLLDALARAEGLTVEAGSFLLVTQTGQTGPRVLKIPVRALINQADPALNVELTGGEEIRVPEAGRVFIAGNVKKPGAFPIRDGESGTLLQMLALAEGLSPFASKQAYIYRAGPGARSEVRIELDEILRRKQADVTVLPDDIIYIPDNKGRRLSVAAIERILAFGSSAGATALVYGYVR